MAFRRIGVVVDTVGEYGRGAFRGITRYCWVARRWGMQCPPLNSYVLAHGWEEWDVDGYIAQVTDETMLEALQSRGLPAVNISNSLPTMPLPSVLPDNHAIGRLAAEHLIARGLRHFGCMGRHGTGTFIWRLGGFRACLEAAGCQCDVFELTCRTSVKDQVRWLASLPKPVGLLLYNDFDATQLMVACRTAGILIPEEVAVVGVDNDEMLRELGGVSLSSVPLPTEQIGYRAAALLDSLLQGNAPPRHAIVLPPLPLIARQSSDSMATHDTDVAKAVQFIREHAHEPIGVRDVVRHVLVGRRSLERRFQQAIRRSPLHELTRARIERIKRLLVETDMQMPEIARRCGFTSSVYMASVFRREEGTSPQAYRQQFAPAAASHHPTAGA